MLPQRVTLDPSLDTEPNVLDLALMPWKGEFSSWEGVTVFCIEEEYK